METKKKGKEFPIEDGHPASFRNADGTMKNIYDGNGNLTEEGKTVMLLRESLSKESFYEKESENERKRKRKLIIWSGSVIVIVFFLLFFHIYISSEAGFNVFAKSTPTFTHTFITDSQVDDVLERYNNASIFEKVAMLNEPFMKLLIEKGIINIGDKENDVILQGNEVLETLNSNYNEQQESQDVETYEYYYDGNNTNQGWLAIDVSIYYGKNEIKRVSRRYTMTYTIVGDPIYEDGCTTYNVNYRMGSRTVLSYVIKRFKDETRIINPRIKELYEIYRNEID